MASINGLIKASRLTGLGRVRVPYLRPAVAVLSILGIAFLLWTYVDQNRFAAESYAYLRSQAGSEAPPTPAELVDLSHQACLLDVNISNIQSFLQPMRATASGGGWCGNYTRVFMRFAQIEGYPANKLHIQSAGRSHTLAEVYYQGQWRVVDPFFNLVYLRPDGEMATLEDLAASPDLVNSPTRRPLTDEKLERIHSRYVPIFPALFRDAGDFVPGVGRSALFHNGIVLLSYPLAPFYEGPRHPILPIWIDRAELLGIYALSLVFLAAAVPPGVGYLRRNRRRKRV